MSKQYISARGKVVDLDLLAKKHELTPAVGNIAVNARGDELGPGGVIVRKKSEVIKDYYKPTQIKDQVREKSKIEADNTDEASVEAIGATEKKTSQNTKAKTTTSKQVSKTPPQPTELTKEEKKMLEDAANDDAWIEDADGNFKKKES